jgi:hypothetical protein
MRDAIQVLSIKLGVVALVLGCLHLVNVAVFSRMRRNALRRKGEAGRPFAPIDRNTGSATVTGS